MQEPGASSGSIGSSSLDGSKSASGRYTLCTLLISSVAKYVPQLYLQHKLKSTAGFATSAVILDIIGSCLSLLQLTISSLRIGDPSLIWGNPAKFGLGLLTLLFDFGLVCQSIRYKGREPEDKLDETTPLLNDEV